MNLKCPYTGDRWYECKTCTTLIIGMGVVLVIIIAVLVR